jgi:uncharacterized protein YqgC (DUF456 family)
VDPILIVAFLLVAAGAAGTVVPVLPGVPLVFAGLLLAAWSDRFERVGWLVLALLALLTLASIAVDLAAGTLGAKRAGASWQALVGAGAGSLVGLFFGFAGILLGPFLGAVAGEYLARRELRRAGRVGLGTWIGMLVSAAAKIAIVLAMIALFAFAWLV